jgi:hypothetical protein
MMRVLIWGILSLLFVACHATPVGVCDIDANAREGILLKTSTQIEGNTRDAVVKVFSMQQDDLSFGTGTLYRYKGEVIVITSAHVLGSPSNVTVVSTSLFDTVAKVVYFDRDKDIAVLSVPDHKQLKPMRLAPIRDKNVKVGLDVVYTGFPNMTGPLTMRGYIAGSEGGLLVLHSYAWNGASGSSIFTRSGNLVGILMAIEVGQGFYGYPTSIEDVVYIVPIWLLDFDQLDRNLKI